VGAARPDPCLGTGIRRRLRAWKVRPGLTGRPAICRPVPRPAVRNLRPSPNQLRRGVTRPSRIRRRPPRRMTLRQTAPRRTALGRTALGRTALPRPLPRPTAPHRTKPLHPRAGPPASCRAGPPGSLVGDRARRPAALPPGPARHRHQPPRPPRIRPSPSPHARRRSRHALRSPRARGSRQVGRPLVSQLRRSPPVKRQSQRPPAKRRTPSLPARMPSHSQPPGRPDRTGRLVLIRRTPRRQGARPSR